MQNGKNEEVQRIEGPVKAGFHRVAWDLRYPDAGPWSEAAERPPWAPPAAGVMAQPGTYSVTMAVRRDGTLGEESEQRVFEVMSIRKPTLIGPSQAERLDFSQQVERMSGRVSGQNKTLGELLEAMTKLKEVLVRTTGTRALYADTHALHKSLIALKEQLSGNDRQSIANVPGPATIMDRLGVAGFGERSTLYGPTATQKEMLAIAQEEYAEFESAFNDLVGKQLPALKKRLDEAGTPWSPGLGLVISP